MSYSALINALRSIPRHQCFGIFIRELTGMVERSYPNPSPLEENSATAWALIATRSIYSYTGDAVSGSLACALLISYLISTPTYAFLFWAICLVAYYLIPSPMANLLRSIPRHEGFGNLLEELTRIIQWRFPSSSPLVEITVRTLTFVASRSIYRCTGDVISGSLACAVLISFLISPDETPLYVFIIWAIRLVSYLKDNNRALISGD